jgi:hypothetical protein
LRGRFHAPARGHHIGAAAQQVGAQPGARPAAQRRQLRASACCASGAWAQSTAIVRRASVICSSSISIWVRASGMPAWAWVSSTWLSSPAGALLAQASKAGAAQRALGHFALGQQPGQGHIAARHLGGQLVGGGGAVGLGGARLAQGGLQLGACLPKKSGDQDRPACRLPLL